jgi:hypothetical protein
MNFYSSSILFIVARVLVVRPAAFGGIVRPVAICVEAIHPHFPVMIWCSPSASPLLSRDNSLLSACSASALLTPVYAVSAFKLIGLIHQVECFAAPLSGFGCVASTFAVE